ncbi:MAG: leucine-rich repeat protein [Clostridia bacterium]|nr:leucine-rich repeat protein [Clostridia bacterium]
MGNKRLYFSTAIIIVFFAILLLLSFSCTAEESTTIVDSGRCGDDITWTLDNSGELRITGTGDMYDYKYIESLYVFTNPFYDYPGTIKSVFISEGITKIGDYIFEGCRELESVVIPDSVTYIGRQAFGGCYALKNVTIPDSVKIIENGAFSNCRSLTSIDIPYGVTTIKSAAFYNCQNLIRATIPDSVTYIGSEIFYNTKLYRDTTNRDDGVLYIGKHMIAGNSLKGTYAIKEGTITIAGYAFRESYITNVIIPNSVVSIGPQAFNRCRSLTEVVIPDSVTLIGGAAFSECNYLKSVTIPDSVVLIEGALFYYTRNASIKCYVNSYAHNYAENNNIQFEFLPCRNCVFTEYTSDRNGNCAEDGTMTAICENGCGTKSIIIEENSKIHDYIFAETIDATCVANGKTVYVCNLCNTVYAEVIPMPGPHVFGIYEYNNDATCISDGTETAACELCGFFETRIAEDSALGHSFTDYQSDNNSTCIEQGTMSAVCDNGCGAIDYMPEEAKGHLPGSWIVIEEPDYFYEGRRIQNCTICSKVLKTEFIPVLVYEGFPDVWEGSWYSEGIEYCFKHGYILGTDEGIFKPGAELTREQFVVILARISGAKLSEYTQSTFNDINVASWYGASVIWANTEGLVYGIGNGRFGIGQPMTREQLAVILCRYSERHGLDVSEKADVVYCDDRTDISTWALDACAWAIKAGLLGSTSETANLLSPKMTVTRAQAAKIFMRYDSIE